MLTHTLTLILQKPYPHVWVRVPTVRGKFVTSAENARDSGQSSTNTSNTQQHSQQLSSRVAGIIHFNL